MDLSAVVFSVLAVEEGVFGHYVECVSDVEAELFVLRGVVDFIDVWIGQFHWPTFNVADMAVSCGAIALAAILWSEGREEQEKVVDETASSAEATP